MSNTDNPFQSPQYRPPTQPTWDTTFQPPKSGSVEIEYLRMYNFIFENPNWFTNLLLLGVCQLIPVVGPIVTMGYQFIVTESLHRRTHPTYPDFDFNRFGEYLVRGVWPFLISLIVAMLVVPVILGGLVLSVFASALAARLAGPEWAGMAVAVMVVLTLVLFLVFVIVVNLAFDPIFLRAGLSQDFGQALNWVFMRDFASKMWKEVTLLTFFFLLTSTLVMMAGFAIFGIGIYLALSVVMLAQAHCYLQLYELYLSRGGMQIPLKPEAPQYASGS